MNNQCLQNRYELFIRECAKMTNQYNQKVIFSVLQCDENFQKQKLSKTISQISEFYDLEYTGNADYIHIPNFNTVFENYLRYPILIAYQINDGQIDILGMTTIKDYHNITNINPYYPIKNSYYYEITGLIAKKNSPVKGIGKHLNEIATIAIREHQKLFPQAELVYVADCRNYRSVNAAKYGSSYVRQLDNSSTHVRLIGYYTVVDDNNNLLEAPTFVLKFETTKDLPTKQDIIFSYQISDNMFQDMETEIRSKLAKFGIKDPIRTIDEGTGIVNFYELEDKSINIDDIQIITNQTDLGNDRIPKTKILTKKVVNI